MGDNVVNEEPGFHQQILELVIKRELHTSHFYNYITIQYNTTGVYS